MTGEEYDLQNAKAAKIRKYGFLLSITVFVLTSYFVGFYIPVSDFIFSVFVSFFFGLVVAALLVGMQVLGRTNLQFLFSISISIICGVFFTALSSYFDDEIPRESRHSAKLVISINCFSLIFSIGLGALLSFRSEIERIAKMITVSVPEKKNILNIQDSENN